MDLSCLRLFTTHNKRILCNIVNVFFIVFAFVACSSLQQPTQNNAPEKMHKLKVAIVDHLSLSHPNQAFVNECSDILKKAGYAVDYYKGEEVTVEFYRNLPALEYDLIVFRVHSAYIHKYLSLAMFTSEPYSEERYVQEQVRNRVARGFIEPYRQGDPDYLAITDKFVRYSMQGFFKNTTIIMMGCTGIKKAMASAFLEKGAKVYIGWNGLVSANHTDVTTIRLLRNLLLERKTIAQSVEQTMKEVGYDAQYKSMLLFWPIEAGNTKVQTSQRSDLGNSELNPNIALARSTRFYSDTRDGTCNPPHFPLS